MRHGSISRSVKIPLEKGLAIHSSILAWRIPWTEEPGGLPPMGLRRVRHDWSDLASTHSAHRAVQTVSSAGSQRRRWFPRRAPPRRIRQLVSTSILKYCVLAFTHQKSGSYFWDLHKNCMEDYPLPCPSSRLPDFADCLLGVLLPPPYISMMLCAEESFLSAVSHFDQGQAPPTASMSVSCLSWPQKLHFVPRSVPHLVTTQDSSAPVLWYEEKMLIQVTQREYNYCFLVGPWRASSLYWGFAETMCVSFIVISHLKMISSNSDINASLWSRRLRIQGSM